jgi:hypothetical protein
MSNVDHFAAFRRVPIKNVGNTGEQGNKPEHLNEIKDFSPRSLFPSRKDNWGTGEQSQGSCSPRSPVIPQVGEQPKSLKAEQNQTLSASVPRVPQVPRRNIDKAGNEVGCAVRNVAPDSRHPLITDEVRKKIEAVEVEARALNWPAELLWNAGFWDCPRGLAAVLDPTDEIGDVTPDYIDVWKLRRDRLRFMRCIS